MDVVVLARFLLTGVAILLAVLAAVTWSRRQDAPEASIFALIMASMAIYTFGYAGEIAQTQLASARFWLNVEYLALPWVPGLWLLAVARHNQLRMYRQLFFVIPLITFVGHFTNYRDLFYNAPMSMEQRGPFSVLMVHRGPLSTLDNAYLLVAFMVGAGIYVSRLRHASTLFRKQALVLVCSSFLPFVGYFVYLADLSPYGLDTAPITLAVTCCLMYYGIFHCGMFELVPLSRNLIFNSMRDGVLILDTHRRLLDFNPAAEILFPGLKRRSVGKVVHEVLAEVPDVVTSLRDSERSSEFTLGVGEQGRTFEMRNWPLVAPTSDRFGRTVGRAVIFSDVSAQARLREELRTRSETDALTGVANRRRFHQALEIECLRYIRGHAPLSLLMIDLDNFKDVNDRYGHPAGDIVLHSVAQLLLSSLRKTDQLARYGGEEFAVLLPETRMEGALVIAERIRKIVGSKPIVAEGECIPISVSVGVASHANDSEVKAQILLKKADLALYRAKTAGRNRVEAL
jgi:diguanylate cyclase (GGDEF)-like protein